MNLIYTVTTECGRSHKSGRCVGWFEDSESAIEVVKKEIN